MATPKFSQLSVLVVQNDQAFARSLKEALEQDNYRVKIIRQAQAALDYLAKHTPQIILADLDLPDISGPLLLRSLKNSCPQVPLVFLSSPLETSEIMTGLELGAEDYLLKPIRPRAVLARLNKVLARFYPVESTQVLDQIPAFANLNTRSELSGLKSSALQLPAWPLHERVRQRGFDDPTLWMHLREPGLTKV